MRREPGRLRRAAAAIARVPLGPWPLYPAAVVLVVLYSMVVRSFTRINSQPEGAEPISGMLVPVLVMLIVTTAVAGLGMLVGQRVLMPREGRAALGRARYLGTLLFVGGAITMTLIATRVLLPDGAPTGQAPLWWVALSTAIVAVFAVVVTNGATGYAAERLRRQEESVRAERSLLLAANETVRAETARQLHDEMQSTLLRSSMRLSGAAASAADPALRETLAQVVDEIDAVREGAVRGVGRRLSPPLTSTGLIAALRELADGYGGVMDVQLEVDAPAQDRFRAVAEGDRHALGVYRVVEQGLQNALKHGRAAHALVDLSLTEDGIHVRIAADGASPDGRSQAGTGAAIINAWLDDLGGRWSLMPRNGGGSVLDVRFYPPSENGARARRPDGLA